MKAIEYKNVTADDILFQIVTLRFAQGLIKDLITQQTAENQRSISIIEILTDYYDTVSQIIRQLELRHWLLSNNHFGAN